MQIIKVLGTGCARCNTTESIVKAAVEKSTIQAKVIKVSDISEIAESGITITPAVIIDGQVKSTGRIPSVEEVLGWIKA